MSVNELRDLLEHIEDTRELVIAPGSSNTGHGVNELLAVWRAARAEANFALDAWRTSPSRVTYAVYRAAEDRADAAEDALARTV